jgi:hypothetical protein
VVVNASSQQIVVELLYWFIYRYLCRSCYRRPLPNSTVFWYVVTAFTMCISLSLSLSLTHTHTHTHTHTKSTTTSKAWTKNHSKILHIYQLLWIYTSIFSNTTILSDIPQLWMETSTAVVETHIKRNEKQEAYDESIWLNNSNIFPMQTPNVTIKWPKLPL